MAEIDRRGVLALGLMALAGGVRAEERKAALEPLSAAERESIRWGEAADGLQSGLRVLSPQRTYAVGSHVDLALYVRNRTEHSVRFAYYPAFAETTAQVTGPDGKPVQVEGVTLLGLPTSLVVALPARETLAIEHPGLWLLNPGKPERKYPGCPVTQAGHYRITQPLSYSPSPGERQSIPAGNNRSGYTVTVYAKDGRPRCVELPIVVSRQDDFDHKLPTGVIEIRVQR